MCTHGTLTYINLNQPRDSGRTKIPVDSCIAQEIQELNNLGVITYGCCCGHGQFKPQCLIDITSKELLETHGYELKEFSKSHSEEGIYEIMLKTHQ